MPSLTRLPELLFDLRSHARRRGWTGLQLAKRVGMPPETLSRLWSRKDCALTTLAAVAGSLDLAVHVAPPTSLDGLWPASYGREQEERLIVLIASGSLDPVHWRSTGPAFFMAGVAMLAGIREPQQPQYFDLAEQLHPGISEVRVLQRWMNDTPVSPSRFFPMLDTYLRASASSR